MNTFENKVAAVTGAGSGIGQQLAVKLAEAGCQVALGDVNEAGLKETQALIEHTGVKVTSRVVDVSDRAAVADWAASVVKEHGKVNMIFNNAGVALAATVEGIDYAEYEWLMSINFWGVVYGTKEFLPYIKETKDGHIVNVSSVFGLAAPPLQNAYSASKFAVRGFTESLRQELDYQKCGVSALCVYPGSIKTNIANTARISDSVKSMGVADLEKSTKHYNKMMRMSPAIAADMTLKAVKSNKRRVMIGSEAVTMDILQRLMPQAHQKLMGIGMKMLNKQMNK